MAEIKASANFSSVVQELSKVTTAYSEYTKKAGKAITANKILITSFKDLNSVLKVTVDLINSSSAPLRAYTKNFNQSTQSIRGARSATSNLASENKNFAITVQKTTRNLSTTKDKLLEVREAYRTSLNTVVKTRDALTGFGKQMIANVGAIDKNGKTVLTFNSQIRTTTKNVLALSKTLVELRAKGNVGRTFTDSANKLRVMRQESEKLNRAISQGLGPMAQMSASASKYGSRVGSVAGRVNKTATAVTRLTLSMQTFVRLGLFSLASRSISLFTSGLRNASSEAIDFEKKISAIRTISTESQLSFNEWAGGIREVADEFNIPLLEATSSVYTSISNQVVKGAEAFDFLRANANLAITAQGSISDAISATSSILKSYNLDVSEVNNISAKLFKTAELGRVPLASIGETIGTVTVIASRAGISFDEVASSLATMTVQGIKPVKAITFLRNTILKILKPTDAMKEAVEKMGFASAETAVRTLGLGRFLDELRKTTTGTASELATLLGSVRAMQAGFAISGPALSAYEENLKKIGVASKDFDERITIAKESVGFNFQKELNQASTAMTNLGRQINEVALSVIKNFGGLKSIIETVASLVKTGLVLGAVLLLNKSLLALNVNLKLTGFNFTTMSNSAGFASVRLKRLSLSAIRLGRSLKTAFRAFAPFLAIEATFVVIDKLVQKEKDLATTRLGNTRGVDQAFRNSNLNRLKLLQDFETAVSKTNDRETIDLTLQNNQRVKSLKDALKTADNDLENFNKKQLQNVKFRLSALKAEETALKDISKTTKSVLDSIITGRKELKDSIFGKGFSALQDLPDQRGKLSEALQKNSVKDIKSSFEALRDGIKEAIASSDNKSFIASLQNELRTIFDTVESRTKAISLKALANQKKIIQERERLELESAKRTQAQKLLDRVDPTAILKETSEEGIKLVGSQTLQDLIDARAFAPSESERKAIDKQLESFTEFYSRRLIQVRQDKLETEKRKTIEVAKQNYKDIEKTLKKEIEAIQLEKLLEDELTKVQKVLGKDFKTTEIVSGNLFQAEELGNQVRTIKDTLAKLRTDRPLEQTGADLRQMVVSGNLLQASVNDLAGVFQITDEEALKLKSSFANIIALADKAQPLAILSDAGVGGRRAVENAKDILENADASLKTAKGRAVVQEEINQKSKTSIELGRDGNDVLEKTANKMVKIRDAQASIVEDTKKIVTAPNALNRITLKTPVKDKASDTKILKEVTSEGTLTGLAEITQPITEIWANIFGNALTKATKKVGINPSGETTTDPKLPTSKDAQIAVNTLELTGVSTQTEKERNKIQTDPKKQLLVIEKELEALKANQGSPEVISIKEGQIRILKNTIKELPKDDSKFDTFVKENAALTNKVKGVGDSLLSLDAVISGASDKIDLSGLSAFGAGIGAAAGAVQFFANQLLGGKKKGLTSRQRNSSILQGAVGGATAGASVGGGYGAVAGAFLGAGIAYYQTRQKGGLIYRAGGGGVPSPAKGTDTVPAMLTQGEFVVNRHSTDKFYSQLKAMNSMTYRADGGRVSNSTVTVGDVNVSPNANSSQNGVNVSQIGNQIRRDIRAGRLGSLS